MGYKILLQLAILVFIVSTPNVFVQSEDDSDGDEAGLDEMIINEICEEDVFQNVSATAQPQLPKVGSKITRKERLLCAVLKIQGRQIKRKKIKAAETKNSNEGFHLPKGYNKKAAPQTSMGVKSLNGTDINVQLPVQLYVYLNIRSVSNINEDKEEVTLDMDMLVVWKDAELLKGIQSRSKTPDEWDSKESDENFRPIPAELEDKIWTPDIFFEEVVLVNRPLVLDKGTPILFNPKLGLVLIDTRFFVTLVCNMDFFFYPSDTQRCPFNLRSGYHTTKELNIQWWRLKSHGVYLHETSDPNFDYRVASISKFDQPINLGPESRPGRNSSYLKFEIYVRRKMSYHLLQTYLPSVFFIIVTWLCFLIPTRMLEIRIAITMTTLLTLTSMFSSVRENTTVVSYVKAIDIWMVTCIFFIFVVLFAFTCEAWIRGARKRLQAEKNTLNQDENLKCNTKTYKLVQSYKAIEGNIESYAALALFSSFLLFNITYWCWLLKGSEYYNWDVDERYNDLTNNYR